MDSKRVVLYSANRPYCYIMKSESKGVLAAILSYKSLPKHRPCQIISCSSLMKPAVTAWTHLERPRANSSSSCTTSSTMTSSQHYLAFLELPISAPDALNLTTMKVNTLVKTIQTIVQLVYRMSAPTTEKPKVSGVQPRFGVTGVNVRSTAIPAFNNTLADLTREKSWTHTMSACAPTSANVSCVKN